MEHIRRTCWNHTRPTAHRDDLPFCLVARNYLVEEEGQ